MLRVRLVEVEAAGVVAVGDERSRSRIPGVCPVGLVGTLADVGVETGVGVGEGERDLGAQFAAVAAVQLVFDRREFAHGWSVLSEPCIASAGTGEGGEGVLVFGCLGLPGVDRGAVAGDGLFDLGPLTARAGELRDVLGEAFVCSRELLMGGEEL